MRRAWVAYVGSAIAGCVAFALAVAILDPSLRAAKATLAPEDDAAIREVLREYQRIYQDFFASGGVPALLDQFPGSKDVRHHVFRDLGFLRDAGLVLVQDLATMEVRRVDATGSARAEAVTFEEWNYIFQTREARAPASKLKGMGQGFTYRLKKADGAWKVVGWEIADVPPPPRNEARQW